MGAQNTRRNTTLGKKLRESTAMHTIVACHVADDITAALVEKAQAIAESGQRVAIVCASSIAREHYARKLDGASANIELMTVRDLVTELMSEPAMQQATGRKPRILSAEEIDVLVEDLKVSGLKTQRLREILKFFYKSMSDLTSREDGWLVTSEEQTIYALLEENMEAREALLPYEASSVALRGVQLGAHALEPLSVIADDFLQMSAASQQLVCELATSGLVAVTYAPSAPCADEPYPNPSGAADLKKRFAGIEYVAVERSSKPTARTKTYGTPADEFDGVAADVAQALEHGITADDLLVAVPNSIWGTYIQQALARQGIIARYDGGTRKPSGDPRYPDKASALRLSAFCKLVIDPSDTTALRSWLGLGDWLVASDSWLELLAWAREHEMSTPQALRKLYETPKDKRDTKAFDKLSRAIDKLLDLDASLEGANALLAARIFEAAGMPLSAEQAAALGCCSGADAPADLAALARLVVEGSATSRLDEHVIVIAPYTRCRGRHAHTLFLTGLVNGFLPLIDAVDDAYSIDHKKRAIERDRRTYECLASIATHELHQSLFAEDHLDNTARLSEQMTRIRFKGGQRVAAIAPSEYLAG